MTRLRDIYGPGHTQAEYLRALAAGHETGYWDERGIPAPWPEDQTDWPEPPDTTTTNPTNPTRTTLLNPSSRRISGYTTSRDLT